MWRFRTTGVAGATIRNDISGINSFLHYHGLGIPLGKNHSERLQRFYRGVDRTRATQGLGQKRFILRALVNDILNAMLELVPRNSRQGQTIRACLLFAKHTAFRCHNYIYTRHGGHVRIKDITFIPSKESPRYFIVTVPRSKTHQIDSRTRETRTVHCRCHLGPCPVHELAELLKGRDEPNEALFLLENGFPMTYSILRQILRTLCEGVGVEWQYYTPHALRIGEATDRTLQGDPVARTMKFIGWRSEKSALIYIRPDNPDFAKFDVKLSNVYEVH